jgi:hypothetical protein
MAENELKDEEFVMFHKLASIYDALVLSAVDPVVVEDINEEDGEIQKSPKMYYDCTEDEEFGLNIMRNRIVSARNDITKHYQKHKRAAEIFYNLQETMNVRNKEKFIENCTELNDTLKGLAELIKAHQTKLEENSFLNYPYTISGRYFHIIQGNRMCELCFNSQTNYLGMEIESKIFLEHIEDFKNVFTQMPCADFLPKDSGEGLIDSSLRARLELNKQLLEGAGLELEW